MKRLIHTEWIKLRGYPTFWTIVGLHAMLLAAVLLIASNINIQLQGIQVGRLFSSDYLWGTVAWIASWFNLLLGILLILLTGNENTFATFRKMLIEGFSRNCLVFGKLLIALFLSLYVFLLVLFVGILVGAFTSGVSEALAFRNFSVMSVLFIQALGYMTLAILFALLFRNNALSIVLYLLYFALIEPIIRLFVSAPWDGYFPVKTIANLTPMPDFLGIIASDLQVAQHFDSDTMMQIDRINESASLTIPVMAAIGYIMLFMFFSWLIVKRRDF